MPNMQTVRFSFVSVATYINTHILEVFSKSKCSLGFIFSWCFFQNKQFCPGCPSVSLRARAAVQGTSARWKLLQPFLVGFVSSLIHAVMWFIMQLYKCVCWQKKGNYTGVGMGNGEKEVVAFSSTASLCNFRWQLEKMLIFMCACYTCLPFWFFSFARALPAASLANWEVMLVGFGCFILNELPLGHRRLIGVVL